MIRERLLYILWATNISVPNAVQCIAEWYLFEIHYINQLKSSKQRQEAIMGRFSCMVIFLGVLTLMQISQDNAMIFSRCELYRELLSYNFSRTSIPRWICVIEHASQRSTSKVTYHNSSCRTYGLFQINNKEWCNNYSKGGLCLSECEDFLNEDLADDVRCALRVYNRHGFKAWTSSYQYCRNKRLPDFSSC